MAGAQHGGGSASVEGGAIGSSGEGGARVTSGGNGGGDGGGGRKGVEIGGAGGGDKQVVQYPVKIGSARSGVTPDANKAILLGYVADVMPHHKHGIRLPRLLKHIRKRKVQPPQNFQSLLEAHGYVFCTEEGGKVKVFLPPFAASVGHQGMEGCSAGGGGGAQGSSKDGKGGKGGGTATACAPLPAPAPYPRFVKQLEAAIAKSVALNGFVDIAAIRERLIDTHFLNRQVLNDLGRSLKVIHDHMCSRIYDTSFDTLYDIEKSLLELKSVRRRDGSKYENFEDIGLGSLLYHPIVRSHNYLFIMTDKVWNTVRRYASISMHQVMDAIWNVFVEKVDVNKVAANVAGQEFRKGLISSARNLLEAIGGFEAELSDTSMTDQDIAAMLGVILPKHIDFWDTMLKAVRSKRLQHGALGHRKEKSIELARGTLASEKLLPALQAASNRVAAVQAAFQWLMKNKRVVDFVNSSKKKRKEPFREIIRQVMAPVVAALALDADPLSLTETMAAQKRLEEDSTAVVSTLVQGLEQTEGLPSIKRLCALESQFAQALNLPHVTWAPLTMLQFIEAQEPLMDAVEVMLGTAATAVNGGGSYEPTKCEAPVVEESEILRELRRVLAKEAEKVGSKSKEDEDTAFMLATLEAELMRVLGREDAPFASLGHGSFAAFIVRYRSQVPAEHFGAVFGRECGSVGTAHAVPLAFARSLATAVGPYVLADVIARRFSGVLPRELLGNDWATGTEKQTTPMPELSTACVLPLEALQQIEEGAISAEAETGGGQTHDSLDDVVHEQTGALDFRDVKTGARILKVLRAISAARELTPLEKAIEWDVELRREVGPLLRVLRSLEVTRILGGDIPQGVADHIAHLRVLELPGGEAVRVAPAHSLHCFEAAIRTSEALHVQEDDKEVDDVTSKVMSTALGLLMADRGLWSSIQRKVEEWLERWSLEAAGRVVLGCIMALPSALQGPFGMAMVASPWMDANSSAADDAVVAAARGRGPLEVATLMRLGAEHGIGAWAACADAMMMMMPTASSTLTVDEPSSPVNKDVNESEVVSHSPVLSRREFFGTRPTVETIDEDAEYQEIGSYDAANRFVRDIWEEYMGANRNQRIVKDYSSLLKRLSDDLYSQKMHFVFELIQNAEDNNYAVGQTPRLDISLRRCHDTGRTELVFSSNEKGFLPKHVEAICRTDYSTKVRDRAGFIGHKGIGFKSVFKVSDRVRIHSRFFHFELDARTDLMGMITPTIVEPPEGWTPLTHRTEIVLELSDDRGRRGNLVTAAEVRAELEKELEPSLLLFLPKIQALRLTKDDGTSITIERNPAREEEGAEPLGKVEVEILRVERAPDGSIRAEQRARYFRYIHTSEVPQRLAEQRRVKHNDIVLVFPRLSTVESMMVYAFLPVSDYGFRFLLHSPFELSSARNTIIEHNEWNEWIREEVRKAMREAVMAVLRRATRELQHANGADDDTQATTRRHVCELLMDVFCRLPLPGELKSFFARHLRVLEELREEPLILTEAGTFVTPMRAVLLPSTKGADSGEDRMVHTRQILEELGYSFIEPGFNLPERLATALGVRRLDERLLVEALRQASSSWLSADHVPLEWLVCMLKTLSREDAGYSHKALQHLGFLPLADGTMASLIEGTVFWLPPGEFDTLMSKLSLKAMPRVLQPQLSALLAGESDAARMLRALGVVEVNLHHFATRAILPALGEMRGPDDALLIMTTFTDHLASGCRACEAEMETLIKSWRELDPPVLCDDGEVRRLSEGLHFSRPSWLPPSFQHAIIDKRNLGSDPRKARRLEELWAVAGVSRFLSLRKQVTTLGHLRRIEEKLGLMLNSSDDDDNVKALNDDLQVEDWVFSALATAGDVVALRGQAKNSDDRRRMSNFARALYQHFETCWSSALTAKVLNVGLSSEVLVPSTLQLILRGTAWIPHDDGQAFLPPADVLAPETGGEVGELTAFPVFPGTPVSADFAIAVGMSRELRIRHFLAALRGLQRDSTHSIAKLSQLYTGLSKAIKQDPEGAAATEQELALATLPIFVPHHPSLQSQPGEGFKPPQRRVPNNAVHGTDAVHGNFYAPKDLVLFDKGDVFDSFKSSIGEQAAKLIRTTGGVPRVLERYYVHSGRSSSAVMSSALLEETFGPFGVRYAPEPEEYLAVLKSFSGAKHEVEYLAPFYQVMLCLAYLAVEQDDQDEDELAEQTSGRVLPKDEVLRRVMRQCLRDGPDAAIFPTLSGRWHRLSEVKFFTQHESIALVKLTMPPALRDVTMTLPDPAWRINLWHKLPPLFDKMGIAALHECVVRDVAATQLHVAAEEKHAATLPVIATLGVILQAAARKVAGDTGMEDILCKRMRAVRIVQVAALSKRVKVCASKDEADDTEDFILESSSVPFYFRLAKSDNDDWPLLQVPAECKTRSLVRGGIGDAFADVILGPPASGQARSALVDPSAVMTVSEYRDEVGEEKLGQVMAEFSSGVDLVDDGGMWEDALAVVDMLLGAGVAPWFEDIMVMAAQDHVAPQDQTDEQKAPHGQAPAMGPVVVAGGFLEDFLLPKRRPPPKAKKAGQKKKEKEAPKPLPKAPQVVSEIDLQTAPPPEASHEKKDGHRPIGDTDSTAPVRMGRGGRGLKPEGEGSVDAQMLDTQVSSPPVAAAAIGEGEHVEGGPNVDREAAGEGRKKKRATEEEGVTPPPPVQEESQGITEFDLHAAPASAPARHDDHPTADSVAGEELQSGDGALEAPVDREGDTQARSPVAANAVGGGEDLEGGSRRRRRARRQGKKHAEGAIDNQSGAAPPRVPVGREHGPIEDVALSAEGLEEVQGHNIPDAPQTDEVKALAYWAEELVYNILIQENEGAESVVWQNRNGLVEGDSMLPYDLVVMRADGRTTYVEVKTRREEKEATVPISLPELVMAQAAHEQGDNYDLILVVRPRESGQPVRIRRVRDLAGFLVTHLIPLTLHIGAGV